MLASLITVRLHRPAAGCRTVMYQVSSAVHPPIKRPHTNVKQQLMVLENCFKTLETTPVAGSDSIHRRRLIYLLESNAKKLKQLGASS